MKKFFVILVLCILAIPVSAEDCMHDPVYETDWNAEVTTGVRIRNIPCMESSSVVATAPVGEILHVIAETDGYYKIVRKDGTIGWIGQWLVKRTDKSFSQTAQNGPLYDVTGNQFETAVRYLAEKGIVGGYPDNSFKPENTVNRAEFVKIVIGAVYGYDPSKDPTGSNIYAGAGFSDTPDGEWYIPYLNMAIKNNVISGYPDGTFRPSSTINLAEASKILVNAMDIKNTSCEGCPWYGRYLSALQNHSYIPDSFKTADQNVKRGEMAELIWRIMEKINYKSFSQIL